MIVKQEIKTRRYDNRITAEKDCKLILSSYCDCSGFDTRKFNNNQHLHVTKEKSKYARKEGEKKGRNFKGKTNIQFPLKKEKKRENV